MTQQALEARIAALEARLRTLEDIEAIKKLTWSYTYFLDYGDLDKVMDNFVDDAIVEVKVRGGPQKGAHVGRHVGRKAIEENIYRPGLPLKDRFTVVHLIDNPVVTVEGDKAKGIFYMLAAATIQTPEGEQATWAQGMYDMEYLNVGGKWKISFFGFLWNFMSPYDDGWVKTPMLGL